MSEEFRSGYISIVGRPNVGKSTLLNHLLEQKLSITSRKPQTTRHNIIGIKTVENTQFVYVDTPGMHKGGKKAMNRYLNRAANTAMQDVNVIVFVIEALHWTDEDQAVLEKIEQTGVPVILAVNKIDQLDDKGSLLPFIGEISAKMQFTDIVPLSALKGKNLEAMETSVRKLLPVCEPFYPEDQITDRSERFLASEIVREKLMRRLGQELPYGISVEIESFVEEGSMYRIHAVIWVERKGQKIIVIGKGGSMLKSIGKDARIDMERLFDAKVFLELWVKVKEGWSDDERALRSLGYTDVQ
ncbi:MAG: GTPase Era [Gammaproteobacteria bacterium]|nr:GTPase Era [Gammaproteobacteria bacterium]